MGYKQTGVYFSVNKNRWLATYTCPENKKRTQLGSFHTEDEAVECVQAHLSLIPQKSSENFSAPKEVWKKIPGWEEFYEVSNLGRVRSLTRIVIRSNGFSCISKGRILKPGVNKGGYEYVNLRNHPQVKNARVHVLVAMAFLNHTPSIELVVDHIDGNKKDNRLVNLQIITHRQNTSKGGLCKNRTSDFVGVSQQKGRTRWRACIKIEKEAIVLGNFPNELEASETYQNALSIYMSDKEYYQKEVKNKSKKEKREYLKSNIKSKR